MTQDKIQRGTILEIIRMSTEDGPGIRTTVFFKGCSLHCRWCHNPESISPKPQIQWIQSSCIGCGICVETCPEKALTQTKTKGIAIDRRLCSGCGLCAEECPTTAMELLGKKWTVHDLTSELVKDRVYFEQSGGGVTLSGGEAALQQDFCMALLKELRSQGIQTALDTCGQVPQSALAGLLPYVDILLYDLKEIDPAKHKIFTGADNEKILANAVFAARFKKTHPYPKTLWIRTPIIPDATDTVQNIQGIGEFIQANLEGAVDLWELCAFNNLCQSKYERLGMDWPFAGCDLPEKSRMEELTRIAKSRVPPLMVCWSGSTRLTKTDYGKSADPTEGKNITLRGCIEASKEASYD